MPLHFDSITNDARNASVIAWILQKGTHEPEAVFATEDRNYILMRKRLTDADSRESIGWLIITMKNNEVRKQLEILDLDIVLDSDTTCAIRFLEKRPDSSDANEYYEVETADNRQHLEVETVNRHMIPDPLTDTVREVHVSIFPFRLSIYDAIDDLNRELGFDKPVEAANTGLFIRGFSERFCMPGGMVSGDKEEDEHYSYIIGKVVSFRNAVFKFGENRLPFVLAKVDTALGEVPVAVGPEVFDLKELKNGCVIAMYADVKADLAPPGVYRSLQ